MSCYAYLGDLSADCGHNFMIGGVEYSRLQRDMIPHLIVFKQYNWNLVMPDKTYGKTQLADLCQTMRLRCDEDG